MAAALGGREESATEWVTGCVEEEGEWLDGGEDGNTKSERKMDDGGGDDRGGGRGGGATEVGAGV